MGEDAPANEHDGVRGSSKVDGCLMRNDPTGTEKKSGCVPPGAGGALLQKPSLERGIRVLPIPAPALLSSQFR